MQILINNFLDKKSNFSSLNFTNQVKYMAYFYTKSTDDQIFTSQNISNFFDLAKLPKPTNISDIILKNKKTFIPFKNGFVLNRDEIKNLDAEFAISSVSEENFKERFYDSGNQFDFYVDMKKIISQAKRNIFIIDSYVDEDLFEMYMEKVPKGVEIKILTNSKNPRGNFVQVARMFAKKKGISFEVRESLECHDRQIFVDDSGWVIGQSIKDNAKNKPAYMIKLITPSILRNMQIKIWNFATKIV